METFKRADGFYSVVRAPMYLVSNYRELMELLGYIEASTEPKSVTGMTAYRFDGRYEYNRGYRPKRMPSHLVADRFAPFSQREKVKKTEAVDGFACPSGRDQCRAYVVSPKGHKVDVTAAYRKGRESAYRGVYINQSGVTYSPDDVPFKYNVKENDKWSEGSAKLPSPDPYAKFPVDRTNWYIDWDEQNPRYMIKVKRMVPKPPKRVCEPRRKPFAAHKATVSVLRPHNGWYAEFTFPDERETYQNVGRDVFWNPVGLKDPEGKFVTARNCPLVEITDPYVEAMRAHYRTIPKVVERFPRPEWSIHAARDDAQCLDYVKAPSVFDGFQWHDTGAVVYQKHYPEPRGRSLKPKSNHPVQKFDIPVVFEPGETCDKATRETRYERGLTPTIVAAGITGKPCPGAAGRRPETFRGDYTKSGGDIYTGGGVRPRCGKRNCSGEAPLPELGQYGAADMSAYE